MAIKPAKTASQSRNTNETPPRKWRWQTIIVVLFVVYALLTTAIFIMHNKIARISSNQAKPAPPAKHQPKNSGAKTPAQNIASYRSDEHQLQQAIREKPQDPQLHNQLAQLHYRHGQTAKAIAEYDRLLPQQPNNPEIHLAIAQLYMGQVRGKTKALDHLRKVLQLAPQHPKKRIIELWIKQLDGRKDKK